MNNSSAPASLIGWIFRLVLLVLGIYVIYWVYKRMYSGGDDTSILIKDIHKANGSAYVYDKSKIPPVFEGGEYSISGWVYINDFSSDARRGKNKDIIKLGDFSMTSGSLVVGLYLDAYDNSMHVITSSAATVPAATSTGPANTPTGTITTGTYNSWFANPGPPTNMAGVNDCKVSPIGYQRWMHFAVILDGKTCDVYLDGKLARSCILPAVFASTKNPSLKVADNGGFGGFISGIMAHNYAMNPEQVYRQFMAGPLGSLTMWEYIKSFFDPKSIGTLDYPKMN